MPVGQVGNGGSPRAAPALANIGETLRCHFYGLLDRFSSILWLYDRVHGNRHADEDGAFHSVSWVTDGSHHHPHVYPTCLLAARPTRSGYFRQRDSIYSPVLERADDSLEH
uniref:Uncharacterized protein n=1 Tax=Micrurus spixii TaxID=129469 RepID=A0A2D4MMA0_9SAUR